MPPIDPSASARLVSALSSAQTGLSRSLERVLARHDLTPGQYELLALLAREGPTPLRQVAENLGVAPGNVTCVVDNLERDGLVERRREPGDRRITRAALTPAGSDRLEALAPHYGEARAALTAGLTIDEQEILVRLLRKLLASAGV